MIISCFDYEKIVGESLGRKSIIYDNNNNKYMFVSYSLSLF